MDRLFVSQNGILVAEAMINQPQERNTTNENCVDNLAHDEECYYYAKEWLQ